MKKIILLLIIIVVSPFYAQQKKTYSSKMFLTNNLILSNQDYGAVLLTPQDGAPISGVVKQQYRNDFLLDIDGAFEANIVVPRKNRQILIPKNKKSVAVNVKTESTNFPGTVFRGKSGLYRLDVNNVLTKNGYYRYRFLPHTLEIATYIGGDINFALLVPEQAAFLNGFFIFNIYTENRKKRARGYTPLVQFRVGYGASPSLKVPTIGLLFGGSQYIFDFRVPVNGLGWSMLVNGGMSFDFSSDLVQQIPSQPFTLGGEVELKAIYNFHKYVGITFGVLLGYHFSPDLSPFLGGTPTDPTQPIYDQNFRGNFSVGLIF
ncbi:MAG: hypothetical protein ACRCY4_02480 [Brevinema sp.]